MGVLKELAKTALVERLNDVGEAVLASPPSQDAAGQSSCRLRSKGPRRSSSIRPSQVL